MRGDGLVMACYTIADEKRNDLAIAIKCWLHLLDWPFAISS